jgi:hypothetical protein
MPPRRDPRHVRIFLASPGDVLEERQAVRDLLHRLERSPLIREDFTIEVVSWDDPDAPVPMLATLTPQQAVRRALPTPSDCDFTIVIVSGRMGTPLEERKPDGSAYLSGTEWEFDDARRAGRPILLYRRMTGASPPGDDAEEVARQLRNVEQFFAQFKGPGGTLRGGVTTYKTVEELTSRLRTDIESLLPALTRPDETIPVATGWIGRAKARVRCWHLGRILLVVFSGVLVTAVAWTAFGTFSRALQEYDAPPLAYALRYALLLLAVVVPLVLLLLTWWWLAGDRTPQQDP